MEVMDVIELLPMSIGPFLVDVPSDWEILDYPDERVTVVREPIESDDPLLSIPGFVIPNLALRFFEMSASRGGVARAATQEAAATYDQVPGSVLLAMSPFVSTEGLPGRTQVMTGIQDGIPFVSSRWYAGDGTHVLELTVTGPGTPMPDLMELGQRIAASMRTAAEITGELTPVIDAELLDEAMMDTLLDQSPLADRRGAVPGLESVALILAARPLNRPVPAVIPLEAEAWSSLLEIAQGGVGGRLMRSSVPAPHERLCRTGLATRGGLTQTGSVWGDLGGLPPVLTIHGQRSEGERRGEIRLDGMDCFATLDQPFPVGRDVDRGQVGSRLAGAFLTLALPSVLLEWCGLRADWFADLQASGPADGLSALYRHSTGNGSVWTRDSGGTVMDGILSGSKTRWTVALADGQPQLSWIQPDARGPMSVYAVEGGDRVRLESTTGLALFEALSRLFREVARSQAATVRP